MVTPLSPAREQEDEEAKQQWEKHEKTIRPLATNKLHTYVTIAQVFTSKEHNLCYQLLNYSHHCSCIFLLANCTN